MTNWMSIIYSAIVVSRQMIILSHTSDIWHPSMLRQILYIADELRIECSMAIMHNDAYWKTLGEQHDEWHFPISSFVSHVIYSRERRDAQLSMVGKPISMQSMCSVKRSPENNELSGFLPGLAILTFHEPKSSHSQSYAWNHDISHKFSRKERIMLFFCVASEKKSL